MRALLGLLFVSTACVTSHEKPRLQAQREKWSVRIKQQGQIDPRSAKFLLLREDKSAAALKTEPDALQSFELAAKQTGKTLIWADDLLTWAGQADADLYYIAISKTPKPDVPQKTCHKLKVLYLLPSDLQEAEVQASFQQEIEACIPRPGLGRELLQSCLRVGLRHLGREGLFHDEP